MLDVFVRETLAARTLRQPHAFAETAVIGFAVFVVEALHGVAAFDADGHCIDAGCGFGVVGVLWFMGLTVGLCLVTVFKRLGSGRF